MYVYYVLGVKNVSKRIYILFDQVHPRTAHGIYGQQVSVAQKIVVVLP